MKRMYVLISILAMAVVARAQNPIISPAGDYSTFCPREVIYYQVIPGPNYSNCGSVTWTVTKGSFSSSSTVTSTTLPITEDAIVYWNDVPEIGTLKATSSCSEGSLTVGPKNYTIRSLKGKTPQNLRIQNGSALPLCSTSPLYIAVDKLTVPNTGVPVPVSLNMMPMDMSGSYRSQAHGTIPETVN